MPNRFLVLALCSLSCGLFFGCSTSSLLGHQEGFVRVTGTRFFLDGHPLYYAGTNVWYGCYIGSPGVTGDRSRLLRELDSLKAMGLVNLRILGASEDSYITRSVKPAIQQGPGRYDEDLLKGLDFLLSEMAKRRMHAVIYLNNYWEWSGGMAQYIAWAGHENGPDPENPSQGWNAFMDYAATFYTNHKANEIYHDYVRSLIQRTNTVDGHRYVDDPTIMAWQLANEPRPDRRGGPEGKSFQDFCRWIDSTSAFIHGLDTNHLVCTGSEGAVAMYWSDTAFAESHKGKGIDYLTVHLWPKNWGWFDPNRVDETLPSTKEKALAYLLQHISVGRRLGKPVVMEEFGIPRDSAACSPGMPSRARDEYYAMMLQAVYDSASAGAPIAGTNFWTWGGEGRGRNPDNMWRVGDPFTGDPPQEPQGYNSIFLGDRSTLAIISAHAQSMLRLGSNDSLAVLVRR